MGFFRKSFSVKLEDWKPEAVDKRTIREENASFIRDSVETVLDGSRPFMVDFADERKVTIAQMTVSGTAFYPAQLKETDNWVSFVLTGEIEENKPFGNYPERIFADYRIGNDEKAVGTQYASYHLDTPNIHRGEVTGIPWDKAELPVITEFPIKKV